jgi:hypothetical protein
MCAVDVVIAITVAVVVTIGVPIAIAITAAAASTARTAFATLRFCLVVVAALFVLRARLASAFCTALRLRVALAAVVLTAPAT